MSFSRFAATGLLIAALGAALLAGCARSQAGATPAAAPPPAVSVAEVVARPLRDF